MLAAALLLSSLLSPLPARAESYSPSSSAIYEDAQALRHSGGSLHDFLNLYSMAASEGNGDALTALAALFERGWSPVGGTVMKTGAAINAQPPATSSGAGSSAVAQESSAVDASASSAAAPLPRSLLIPEAHFLSAVQQQPALAGSPSSDFGSSSVLTGSPGPAEEPEPSLQTLSSSAAAFPPSPSQGSSPQAAASLLPPSLPGAAAISFREVQARSPLQSLKPNMTLAIHLYAAAAAAGNASAQYTLAVTLLHGLFGFPQDPAAAVLHLYFSALQGHRPAMMALGYRHSVGQDVPEDCFAAVSYLQPLAREAAALHEGFLQRLDYPGMRTIQGSSLTLSENLLLQLLGSVAGWTGGSSGSSGSSSSSSSSSNVGGGQMFEQRFSHIWREDAGLLSTGSAAAASAALPVKQPQLQPQLQPQSPAASKPSSSRIIRLWSKLKRLTAAAWAKAGVDAESSWGAAGIKDARTGPSGGSISSGSSGASPSSPLQRALSWPVKLLQPLYASLRLSAQLTRIAAVSAVRTLPTGSFSFRAGILRMRQWVLGLGPGTGDAAAAGAGHGSAASPPSSPAAPSALQRAVDSGLAGLYRLYGMLKAALRAILTGETGVWGAAEGGKGAVVAAAGGPGGRAAAGQRGRVGTGGGGGGGGGGEEAALSGLPTAGTDLAAPATDAPAEGAAEAQGAAAVGAEENAQNAGGLASPAVNAPAAAAAAPAAAAAHDEAVTKKHDNDEDEDSNDEEDDDEEGLHSSSSSTLSAALEHLRPLLRDGHLQLPSSLQSYNSPLSSLLFPSTHISSEMLEVYRDLAEQGNQVASFLLGYLSLAPPGYSGGTEGRTPPYVPRPDYAAAFAFFSTAAVLGDQLAHSFLSLLYMQGLGVQQDYAKAVQHLQEAAAVPSSQVSLAVLQRMGLGTPRDPTAAYALLKQVNAVGFAEAAYNLAMMHLDGSAPGGRDFTLAKHNLQLAAGKGHAMAAYKLGRMYWTGVGTNRDCKATLRHYLPIAMLSRNKLGAAQAEQLLLEGNGQAALLEWLRTAEQGSMNSYWNAALLMDYGYVDASGGAAGAARAAGAAGAGYSAVHRSVSASGEVAAAAAVGSRHPLDDGLSSPNGPSSSSGSSSTSSSLASYFGWRGVSAHLLDSLLPPATHRSNPASVRIAARIYQRMLKQSGSTDMKAAAAISLADMFYFGRLSSEDMDSLVASAGAPSSSSPSSSSRQSSGGSAAAAAAAAATGVSDSALTDSGQPASDTVISKVEAAAATRQAQLDRAVADAKRRAGAGGGKGTQQDSSLLPSSPSTVPSTAVTAARSSMEMAADLYATACKLDQIRACYSLGFCYEYGEGVGEIDYHLAKRHYDKALALAGRRSGAETPLSLALNRLKTKMWLQEQLGQSAGAGEESAARSTDGSDSGAAGTSSSPPGSSASTGAGGSAAGGEDPELEAAFAGASGASASMEQLGLPAAAQLVVRAVRSVNRLLGYGLAQVVGRLLRTIGMQV